LKPFNQVDLKTMWSLPIGGLFIDNFIAGYKQLAPNINNSLKNGHPRGAPFLSFRFTKWVSAL